MQGAVPMVTEVKGEIVRSKILYPENTSEVCPKDVLLYGPIFNNLWNHP